MHRNVLDFIPFVIVITVILTFPVSHIYASEIVKWKTFKEKNGLFTIKYPSNWIPQKIDEIEGIEITSPINMNFVYSVKGSLGAMIGVTADESIYTNVTDSIDSMYAYAQGFSKYELVEPMECIKYMINGINACSTVLSYKNVELPGKPIVNELDVVTIDEDGVQYVIYYIATKNLFDDFLPVIEEMIGSFSVTGNILFSDDESTFGTNESPNLPPLTESPVKKL